MDKRYGNGATGMFEGGEIVPFFVNASDEAIGRVLSSMNGRFGFRKDVWAVVSGKLERMREI